MNAAELKELAADIKKNGLIADIVRDKDGLILDGRNRLDACHLAGVEPRFVQFNGNDPIAFVIAVNIRRRHLTTKQKTELVKKLLKFNPEKSDRQIAADAKADHKTVAKERRKAEARGEIPHVSRRADSKGRRQPATKTVQPRTAKPTTPTGVPNTPPKPYPDSVKCLAEFRTACDHWLPKLNADDLKKAGAYCRDRIEGCEKSRARPADSAERSVVERRAAMEKLAAAD
jgi:hypothetical protein